MSCLASYVRKKPICDSAAQIEFVLFPDNLAMFTWCASLIVRIVFVTALSHTETNEKIPSPTPTNLNLHSKILMIFHINASSLLCVVCQIVTGCV